MTTTIQFDTAATEGRTETGVLEGNVLRTSHNARPDFRIKGAPFFTVTLLSAKTDAEIEGFGHNLEMK